MRRGYGWIFPKRDHLNVGIYSPWGGQRMREQLDAFLATHALLRNHEVVSRMGFAIPLFDPQSPVALGRTLAIGDAGGFAEGVYGEGIYYAMRTGQMAAEAIIDAGDGEAGRHYGERVARELSPELKLSTWLGRAYFAFPRFAFRHLAMDPRGQDRFTGIITGDTTYRDCVAGALRRAPRWLFRTSPP
jgi:flavin-dependent dehydrogenase